MAPDTPRLVFGPRLGPAREIHAGSGYWSQDSPVQVLGTPEQPSAIWARWPDGQATTREIPTRAAGIEVSKTGPVVKVR